MTDAHATSDIRHVTGDLGRDIIENRKHCGALRAGQGQPQGG